MLRRLSHHLAANLRAAIDLASIMVGVIVIGIMAAIILASVFVIIPWSQDEAAKANLISVKDSEKAYFGLTANPGPASYGTKADLKTTGLLPDAPPLDVLTDPGKKCYVGISRSDNAGNKFYVTDKKPTPTPLTLTTDNGCIDPVDVWDSAVDLDPPAVADPATYTPPACTVSAATPAELGAAFTGATDNTVVCITADITRAAATAATNLDVPAGVNMTVNLQSHTLTVSGVKAKAGIGVRQGAQLDIVDAPGGTGKVNATGGARDNSGTPTYQGGAGIGGQSAEYGEFNAGKLLFRNVTVTAVGGGYGAGIGGGDNSTGANSYGGNVEEITFINSTVTASTPSSGDPAAIGGGGYAYNGGGKNGPILIQNSKVTADPGSNGGAGIGAAYGAPSGKVTITEGSVVTANSSGAAAIGSSSYGTADDITITDSTVTATSSNGAAIGTGYGYTTTGKITIQDSVVDASTTGSGPAAIGTYYGKAGPILIEDSKVTASAISGAGIGSGEDSGSATPSIIINDSIIDSRGRVGIGGGWSTGGSYAKPGGTPNNNITITGSTVLAKGHSGGAAIGSFQSHGFDNITITDTDVDAQTWSGSGGAGIGGGQNGPVLDVTISGGTITATSDDTVGIGSGNNASTHSIVIKDGADVTAAGKYGAIGGTTYANIDTITIADSKVVATQTGSSDGAAIGGGYNGTVNHVNITNSDVTGTAKAGAGIGGGDKAGDITITGSTVTASVIGSGSSSPGIGGHSLLTAITITGSTVNATGNDGGAGIGLGNLGHGGNITISTSTVTATGGTQYGAGIGGGYGDRWSDNGNGRVNSITINSGTVTATGGTLAAGIGGGVNGKSGHIVINGGTVTAVGDATGGANHIGDGWLDPSFPHENDVTITGGKVNGVQH